MKKVIFSLLLAMLLLPSYRMSALNLPVKNVNGKQVYYYTFVKGDKLSKVAEKIGVTVAQLKEYNPQVNDVPVAGTVVTFPVTYDAFVKDGYYVTRYKVKPRESVYDVRKLFDIPMTDLMTFNPEARKGIDGLTLLIPLCKAPADAKEKSQEPAPVVKQQRPVPDGCYPYLVKPGETVESIAADNGLSVAVIKKLNPDTDFNRLTVGEMIFLPNIQSLEPSEDKIKKVTVSAPVAPAVVEDKNPVAPAVVEEKEPVAPAVTEVEEPVTVSDMVLSPLPSADKQQLTIAVMLPFMLDETSMSRNGKLYTEFYRGFLMGVEQMSHSGTPLNIVAFDTQDSLEIVSGLLDRPELADVNLFIGPDNQEQLALIASRARQNDNSYLLNIFSVKDNSYLANPSVIQANIPHPAMYRKAVSSFMERYPDRIPVFISRIGGSGEKIEFVDSLKQALTKAGREYKEINFKNFLGRDNLEDLNPDSLSYVFVPGSGSRQEFNKFAPAIKNLRNSAIDHGNVVLYGYPEYIMFRGDNLDMLHSLNTTIYSRYLSVPELNVVQKGAAKYKEMYGEEMEEAVPMQALIGYDTAIFLITSLRNNDGRFSESSMDYDGLQMGYSLEEVPGGGLVNENLYLIEYRPGGKFSKVRL
ncbi:MAG: LysM peptidoglycan-binding domain-containing protein [Muribaculaceae bacterium]|nr:LysM peptidoglycan-binding domain-containing protein [Muribaculaceae bacterium]